MNIEVVTLQEAFRVKLKARREALGLTQAQVASRARRFGFSEAHQPTIARIERGDRGVGLDEAAVLARAVQTPFLDMLHGVQPVKSARIAENDAVVAALGEEIEQYRSLLEEIGRLATVESKQVQGVSTHRRRVAGRRITPRGGRRG